MATLRVLVVLLALYAASSVDAHASAIALVEARATATCPLHQFDAASYYESPAPRAGASPTACKAFNVSSCCTPLALSRIASRTDDVHRHLSSLLGNISDACVAELEHLSCSVCSPDQSHIFTVYEFEKHLTVCDGLAARVLRACSGSETLKDRPGTLVSQAYRTGAGLVQYLLEPLYQVGVPIRNGWRCYDPTLRPCTLADYNGFYTECVVTEQFPLGVRSAFFLPRAPGTCNGGVVPDPVRNVSCSIPCDDGRYLPVGAERCELCAPGTFSIGGGYRLHTFREWPTGFMARSYCVSRPTGAPLNASSCRPWVLDETNVHSGAITDDQQTVLEIAVQLVRAGHVTFEWQVEAEQCDGSVFECDGFLFNVDGVRKVNLTGIAPLTRSTFALSAGLHTLQFVYSKDQSLSQGADRAQLTLLEVEGLYWADSSCTECPHGTFSAQGAADCTECARDTASDETATANACPACDAVTQYAMPGATKCQTRPVCAPVHAETLYTDCEYRGGRHSRSRKMVWIEPKLCREVDFHLAAEVPGLECDPCQPGFRRLAPYGDCVGCPEGQRIDPNNALACVPCAAGTFAHKTFAVDHWNSWPDWVHHATLVPLSASLEHSCVGRGCVTDWRLAGTYVDSGVGHRFPALPTLNFTVDIETVPAVLTVQVSFECVEYCQMTVRDYNSSAQLANSLWLHNLVDGAGGSGTVEAHLDVADVGRHSFVFQFDGFLTRDHTQSTGLVRVHQIEVSGARDGSAAECSPCAAGTVSAAGADTCTPCAPGTAAAPGTATPCPSCQGDTFTALPGQAQCAPCGQGTTANAAHTDCESSCVFSTATHNVTYDLRALVSTDMYGPIVDPDGHQYYLSVCDKSDRRHACHDKSGQPIKSFVCQITNEGVGVDIGDLMAFAPLSPPWDRDGFNLTFSAGAVCGSGKARAVTVAFVCDPDAGRGHPDVPAGHNDVEFVQCQYEFVWRSEYACPLCSAADWTQTLGECEGTSQQLVYSWKDSPRRCHGGLSLPGPASRPCVGHTVSCAPGMYNANGVCVVAPPGSFSVGNGERVVVGDRGTLPMRFSSGCAGPACTGWAAEGGGDRALQAGLGASWLRVSRNFVFDGALLFEYKVSSSSSAGSHVALQLRVDGEPVILAADSMLRFADANVLVTKGLHVFEWRFDGGAPASSTERARSAFVRNITFAGSRYASTAPTPCPAGYSQPRSGQSYCVRCPVNTRSLAGASTCAACELHTYSLPGARACLPMVPCSVHADYEAYLTPCVGGKRSRVWERLQPVHCSVGADEGSDNDLPPAETSLTCLAGDCPHGQFLSDAGTCTTCPRGNERVAGACVPVRAGSAAVPIMSYFDGFTSSSVWPFGWSTQCSGPCGSSGWRARAELMDSGFHGDEPVDSSVTLTQTFVTPGSIEFVYDVHSRVDGIDFFIDGVHMPLFRPASGARNSHVSFDVAAGQRRFAWVFHQTDGVEGFAQVSQVILRGVEGGGRESVVCPAGTSSGDMASWCRPCPAGSYSVAPGSSSCTPCEVGKFQAHAGQTKCDACPADAAPTVRGATHCETSCKFTFGASNNLTVFDLSPVASTLFGPVKAPIAHDEVFLVQLCAPVESAALCNDTNGAAVTAYVCGVDVATGTGRSYGNLLSSELREGALRLTYTGGADDQCDDGTPRSTVIVAECDEVAALSISDSILATRKPSVALSFVDGECRRVFTLRSYDACRVCNNFTDYAAPEAVGECQNGVEEVTRIKRALCKGAPYIKQQAPCASKLALPLGAVVGVLAALVLAGAGIAFLIWRNRRIHNQYSTLLAQSSSTNELTAVGGGDFGTSLSLEESVDKEGSTAETL